jgi:hypothetical protein
MDLIYVPYGEQIPDQAQPEVRTIEGYWSQNTHGTTKTCYSDYNEFLQHVYTHTKCKCGKNIKRGDTCLFCRCDENTKCYLNMPIVEWDEENPLCYDYDEFLWSTDDLFEHVFTDNETEIVLSTRPETEEQYRVLMEEYFARGEVKVYTTDKKCAKFDLENFLESFYGDCDDQYESVFSPRLRQLEFDINEQLKSEQYKYYPNDKRISPAYLAETFVEWFPFSDAVEEFDDGGFQFLDELDK